MKKWLLLIIPLFGFTRIHPNYSTEPKIREEFANVEDNLQDQQFNIVTSTPAYQELKEGQIVIFYSTSVPVTLMLRAGNTIYTLTGGGGSSIINNFAGGGSGAIFDGSQTVGVATSAFPGATISFSATFATVTYMPVILGTYTTLSNSTATLLSIVNFLGISTQNIQIQMNSQFTAAFSSITDLGISTRNIVIDYRTQFSTTGAQFLGVTASTNAYAAFDNSRASTITLRLDAVSVDTTATASILSQRTVVASDEGGTPKGHVQQFDFVGAGVSYSQTAGTGTVTITAGGGTTNISSPTFAGGWTVTVGTCDTYGAQIVGTMTEVFNAAIATLTARGGGTALVQNGNYYANSTFTVTRGQELFFLSSAVIMFRDKETIQTVAVASGGIYTNMKIDISTDIWIHSHFAPVILDGVGSIVRGLDMRVRINNTFASPAGDYLNGFVQIAKNCVDCQLIDGGISSFTTINKAGGSPLGNALLVLGGTRTIINNFNIYAAKTTGNVSNEPLIEITACDGLTWTGGVYTVSQNLIQIGATVTSNAGRVRGFSWKNATVHNFVNPQPNGLYEFSSVLDTQLMSTGTEISGHRIHDHSQRSNPIFNAYNVTPGAVTSAGLIFSNNVLIDENQLSNGVMYKITDDRIVNTIISNSSIWGSGDNIASFISDGGIGTKYFNRGNTLNGREILSAGANPTPLWVAPPGVNVTTLTFQTSDFRVTTDGVSGATVTWRGSTGTITAPQNFASTNTFRSIHSSTYSVGADNIFYATSTQVGFNNQALVGYIVLTGSVTALTTGGTVVITFPGFTSITFPQVTEVAADAEANQVNISAITTNSFTIKNKSALNAKDAIWFAFGKR